MLVQYWFNGPEIEIKVKPHGNSTSSQPYFRTASSAHTQNKMIAARNTPNTAMHKAVQQQGGELTARGLNKLPRNSQQIRNYRRSETKKDTDVLYSVMLQCKLSEGKSDSFVRDVKAAPDPQCVLYTDWQMSELVKFTTKQAEFSVFVADTTYNLGDFYVTPTTYQHLMLEDSTSHKHPSFLGPTLVHQRKNFSSFNYFSSTLIGANNKLQNVQAFGTDGDLALIEAFSHNFRDARQLRCFIHLKRNISDKLRERGIPSNESSEFIADIFGKNCGSLYEEGLVDAEDAEDFEGRLGNCEEVWLARESKYLREGQVSFYCYFKVHYASIVRSCMLKDLRTSVGLGSPPAIFTTNCSESINAVIKRKVDYKATEWPQFNNALKEIVEGQREEAIRSLSGRGRYRVCKGYKYMQVDPQKWATMSPEQRQDVIKQFDSAPVRPSRATTHSESVAGTSSESGSTSSSRGKLLWVDPEETGITSVPLATLKEIWAKAAEYASSTGDVVPAPGNHPKAKMVSSRSNAAPHFVCAQSSGQYTCDSTCLQWKSSQICSHSVAVAAINGDLEAFVKWYVGTHQLPNFTTLATHGLPAGRGRKGGIPRRPRSRKSSSSKRDISVARPAVAYRDAGSHLTGGVSVSSQHQSHTNASGSHLTGGVSVSSQPQSHTNASGPHLTEGVSVSSQPQSHTNASGPHLTGGVSVSSQPQSHSTTGSEFTPLSQQPPSFTIVNSQSATSLLGIACATPQTQTINIHPKPAPMPTSNPFFVKFIQGNIRVCQGCRGSLKNFDNSLPKAPFDLAVARFERRPYRDRTGEWRTPTQEQAAHYHLRLACIQAVAPEFVLNIPSDVLPNLTYIHKEYLRMVFNVQF